MSVHIHGGDIYRYENVIDFSSNCNPMGMPDGVQKAIIAAVAEASHYPDVECRELRKRIGEKEQVDPNFICCGNGAAELIFSLVMAVKPKKALIPAPTFAEYEQALRAADCQICRYGMKASSGFALEEDFLDAIQEGIHIVFLCNPNNPTGKLTGTDFLLDVLKKCKKIGARLVVDECFLDFIEEPERYTLKSELEAYDNLFLLKAFTKLYGMAGVRLGYGLSADQKLIERIREVTQPWNVSLLAQRAGIAALREHNYVNQYRQILREERQFLVQAIKGLGYTVYEPAANYIFFRGPETLWRQCLDEGILIRDCGNYVGLTPGYYRVAVRLREENKRLLKALEKKVER